MTRNGKSILPRQISRFENDTRAELNFLPGTAAWDHDDWNAYIYPHIYGAHGDVGAYWWMKLIVGQPFFNNDVYIFPGQDWIYNITTNSITMDIRKDEDYFYSEGNWRLNRLMMQAFRDDYYVSWPQFSSGMTSCIATIVQNKMYNDGDEHNCLMSWHGGPPSETFQRFKQMGSIYYQLFNQPAISTDCLNFAGRNDNIPGSGNSQMQWFRNLVCSNFWFKLFWDTAPDFDLFQNFQEQYGNSWAVNGQEPPWGDYLRYLYIITDNVIEETPLDKWLDAQYIIKHNSPSGEYTFLSAMEENDWSDGQFNCPCYVHEKGVNPIYGPYELPKADTPVHFTYFDQQDTTHLEHQTRTETNGWVLQIPFSTFLPIPLYTPVASTLIARTNDSSESSYYFSTLQLKSNF